MIDFLAGIFGYVLNFIYELVKNYGLAIILFSVLLKLLMLPLTIKQQKSMKKNMKIQEKSKEIQAKYKGKKDRESQEKMNQEIMALYKSENTSPFSGCLTSIVQIVLLFSIFFLVRCPLTNMIKMEPEIVEKYTAVVQKEATENGQKVSYPEISLIKLARQKLEEDALEEDSVEEKEEKTSIETTNEEKVEEPETVENNVATAELAETTETVEELKKLSDEEKAIYEKMAINMNFLGLDLSNVPTEDMSNPTVFIIPVLYVISTFISIWLTSNNGKKKNKEQEKEGEKPAEEQDPMAGASKGMLWFMPIMSISIAIIAPLGLALYWLVNNILMIVERLVIDKFISIKENQEEQ